jgi:hypothetical protein
MTPTLIALEGVRRRHIVRGGGGGGPAIEQLTEEEVEVGLRVTEDEMQRITEDVMRRITE